MRKSPSIPLLQRGRTTSAAPIAFFENEKSRKLIIPPFAKGGLGGIFRCAILRPLNEVFVA